MCYRALIVGDDAELIGQITDTLDSLDHDSDVAGSQAEALRFLRTDTYAYVLSDIRIRARRGNGRPRIQNLENFLERLGKLKCPPPVIVISDYPPRGVEEGVDLMRLAIGMYCRAPVDFVAKPLAEKGRTLDRVIKKLLAGKVEPVRTNWPAEKAPRSKAAPSSDAPDEKAGDRSTGDIVTLDEFMARYCEPRSRQVRRCRRKALLAAARHGSIALPPLAAERKHGQANRYRAEDLLAGWQGFLDAGVDVPPLLAG